MKTLSSIWTLLFKRPKVLFLVLTTTTVIGVVVFNILLPAYVARAKILVTSDIVGTATTTSNKQQSSSDRMIKTELVLLKNRYVIEELIKELNLEDAFGKSSVVEKVSSMIKVRPVSGTNIIEIEVRSQKPELVTQIANTLCKIVVTSSLKERFSFEKDMIAWLSEQTKRIRKELDESQQALLDFKKDVGALDLETEYNNVKDRLLKNQNKLGYLKTEAQDAETEYINMDNLIKGGTAVEELPQVLNDDAYKEIKLIYDKNKAELDELLKKYEKGHPVVDQLNKDLFNLNKMLTNRPKEVVHEIERRYKITRAKKKELQKIVSQEGEELLKLEEQLNRYKELLEDIKMKEGLYNAFIKNAEEDLIGGLKIQQLSLIEQAYLPREKEQLPFSSLITICVLLSFIITGAYNILRDGGKQTSADKNGTEVIKDKGMYIERIKEEDQ